MIPRRLVFPLIIPLALLWVGTLGYRVIEGDRWTILDAFYMTFLTLTTIGFSEIHPLSPSGRIFTVFLGMGGIFTLFYAAGEVIRLIISGEIQRVIGRRRMEKSLAGLRDHYLVCGYGRMGRLVTHEFEARKLPFVVIDTNEAEFVNFQSEVGFGIHGDATHDSILKQAGIERAKALVTVASSDADNLYITLSARLLNPKIFIVARAEDVAAEEKLRKVGANQVVSPYHIGGLRVAQAVLRPNVVHFIELATRTDYLEMQIEEVPLAPFSSLVGQSIAGCNLHRDHGVIIIGIKKASGRMLSSPAGSVIFEAGDTLIALGPRQHLDTLEKMATR